VRSPHRVASFCAAIPATIPAAIPAAIPQDFPLGPRSRSSTRFFSARMKSGKSHSVNLAHVIALSDYGIDVPATAAFLDRKKIAKSRFPFIGDTDGPIFPNIEPARPDNRAEHHLASPLPANLTSTAEFTTRGAIGCSLAAAAYTVSLVKRQS